MGFLGRMRSVLRGSSGGFTLVEMLVTVGLMAITTGVIGGGIFQSLGIVRYWRDDAVSVKEVRHALSWFSRDAINAKSTSLTDGAAPTSSVTITWTDQNSVSHSAGYSLAGSELRRNYDGAVITVARKVQAEGFSRSGMVLKLSLTVAASRGGTESKSLEVYARMLQ